VPIGGAPTATIGAGDAEEGGAGASGHTGSELTEAQVIGDTRTADESFLVRVDSEMFVLLSVFMTVSHS
jgi:hypothetical protein